MAVSFSAEYLYQGAKILSRNPLSMEENALAEGVYAVARAVYSLGVFVIAPLGMLYHGGSAAVYATRTALAEERDIAPLNLLVDQHWEAAENDGLIFLSVCTVALAVAAVTTWALFGTVPSSLIYLSLASLAAPIALIFLGAPAERILLPYAYVEDPAIFTKLLSILVSRDYLTYYNYNALVRDGIALDEPLTDAQGHQFFVILSERERYHLYKVHAAYRFLLQHQKIQPAAQARVQAFVNAEPQMREAAIEAANLFASQGVGNNREAAFAAAFMARMHPIIAALPPIGAPVPAQAS